MSSSPKPDGQSVSGEGAVIGDHLDVVQRGPPRPRREPVSAEVRQRDTTGAMPGGHDDGFACPGPITTSRRRTWRDRGSHRRVHGGGRGQHATGRPGWADPALGRCGRARPRLPPDRHGSWPRRRQVPQRAGDCKGLAAGTMYASARRPRGRPGGHRAPHAGDSAGVLVLPLVCVCLGLLRLRPRPVAATSAPGLAVLSVLARAT